MSDAKLDEVIVGAFGELRAVLTARQMDELDGYFLANLEHEPVLSPSRQSWPMATDRVR